MDPRGEDDVRQSELGSLGAANGSTVTIVSAGAQFGPYKIEAPIGAGGMGQVFRATDTRLGRTVAIKTLHPGQVADADRKRRFFQEARAASALNHPNIVTLYDISSQDGIDFLVMEFVPGKSLDRLITTKGLSLVEGIGYAQQMASALAAAHAAGITHRDIKPANVIVMANSQIKILDFGLAKLVDRGPGADGAPQPSPLTEAGTVVGTVAYMSPEQASAQELDHRTDIFSLGVVLYEMLAGKRPFRGKSHVDTMHAIIHDPAPPLERQPPEVDEILAKALAKEPKDRYQHAGDFGLDLRRLQQAWETKSLPSQRGGVATSQRNRGWPIAAAVLLLAVPAAWWIGNRGTETIGALLADVTLTPLTSDTGYQGEPTVSPDGQTVAYVSNRTGRFDIFLRQIGSNSDVPITRQQSDNIQPAFSPDGRQIAFVSTRNGATDVHYPCCDYPLSGGDIWTIPTLGGGARRIVQNGNYPAWSPDGSTIVFGRMRQTKLFQVSTQGGEVRELPLQFQTPNAPSLLSPAYSGDGRWIFFQVQAGQGNNEIYVVAATGGMAKRIGVGWRPVWDAATQSILYSNGDEGKNYSLWSLPFSEETGEVTGAPSPLTVGRGRDWQPAISRNGKVVAFAATDVSFNLETVPFDAEAGRVLGPPRATTSGNQINYFMRFSPDGRSIVFQSTRGGGTHIWRLDQGSEPVQLTAEPGSEDTVPQWSPDGTMVAFLRSSASGANVWLMAADGANPRQAVPAVQRGVVPRWFPNGSGFVYKLDADRQYYIYEIATAASRRITNEKDPGTLGGMPAISLDNQWIAFQSGTLDVNVRAVPVSGGSAQVVVSTQRQDYHPFFSPSGRWLYFQPDHKNLYRVPGPAQQWKKEEPMKITDFPESGLFLEDPQISMDGKQLLYSRANIKANIWILKRGR